MRVLLMILVLGGIIAGASIVLQRTGRGDPGVAPAYSVAGLRELLAAQQASWAERTVVARARAEPCPWWGSRERLQHCADRQLVLFDASGAVGDPIPLERPEQQWLPAEWYSLPVIGELLPRPPGIPTYITARFRVRLLGLPAASCEQRHCYEARLLDVLPDVD
jgi:hypothetical protein